MRSPLLLAACLSLAAAACGGSGVDCVSTPTSPCTGPDGTPTNVTVGFVTKTVVDQGVTYGFQVFIPAGYNDVAVAKVPVILFMHGSAEKGSDNVKQTTVGLGPYVKARESTFPAIVVFPQGPAAEGSQLVFDRIAKAALQQVMAEYKKADPARPYLTGLSYGGLRTFEMASQNQTTFAAVVPISANLCGPCLTGVPTATFAQGVQFASNALKTIPIWQFQGALDTAIPVADARAIRDAFMAVSTVYKYTEYPTGAHDIWDTVYNDPQMWTWLYAKSR